MAINPIRVQKCDIINKSWSATNFKSPRGLYKPETYSQTASNNKLQTLKKHLKKSKTKTNKMFKLVSIQKRIIHPLRIKKNKMFKLSISSQSWLLSSPPSSPLPWPFPLPLPCRVPTPHPFRLPAPSPPPNSTMELAPTPIPADTTPPPTPTTANCSRECKQPGLVMTDQKMDYWLCALANLISHKCL